MKTSAYVAFFSIFTAWSCAKNESPGIRIFKINLAYIPLKHLYLGEKRDSIRTAVDGRIQQLYDDTDCMVSLPSTYYEGQEFISIGYFSFNEEDRLIKAEIQTTLGGDPDIDTTAVRRLLMKKFISRRNPHDSYSYSKKDSTELGTFTYRIQ